MASMRGIVRTLALVALVGAVVTPAVAQDAEVEAPADERDAEGGERPPPEIPEPPEPAVDLEAVLRGDGRGMTADQMRRLREEAERLKREEED